MNDSPIHWFSSKAWAIAITIYTKESLFDPLELAVQRLREHGMDSIQDIASYLAIPQAMVSSAWNETTEAETGEESSSKTMDGWILWDPCAREFLPEIFMGEITNRVEKDAQKVAYPSKNIIPYRLSELQHSIFLRVFQNGEELDCDMISKIEANEYKSKELCEIYTPVEFRAFDVICWLPHGKKQDLPSRGLSDIHQRMKFFWDASVYQQIKSQHMSEVQKPVLQQLGFQSYDDMETSVQAWCTRSFREHWTDHDDLREEIKKARTEEQINSLVNNWRAQARPWGILMEYTCKYMAEGMDSFLNDPILKEQKIVLDKMKTISGKYHSRFQKSYSETLSHLRTSWKRQTVSSDTFLNTVVVAAVCDDDVSWCFRSIRNEHPDFFQIFDRAVEARNTCSHVKESQIVDIDSFRDDVVLFCKIIMKFRSSLNRKRRDTNVYD